MRKKNERTHTHEIDEGGKSKKPVLHKDDPMEFILQELGLKKRTIWEYKMIHEASEQDLNRHGNEGWELVSVNQGVAYLKRKVGER